MWIVRLALRRPYTFVVMSLLIAILGSVAIVTMPVDIFPYIDIPVISVIWSYSGMSPDEMEKRIDTIFERSMTTTVNDIEHIETQAYSGVSVTRVYFQPNVKIEMAMAQVTAIAQTLLRIFPPGTFPPNIVKYDASSVPILQLGLESKTLSEQQIFDLTLNFIRTQLATVQGASVPLPYGGKFREVMVDLNPEALYAKQLSPTDVSNALSQQSLILPAGDAKIGDIDYQVKLNNSPVILDQLNDLPVKVVNGATVYMRDVAQVRDGYAVQTSIVRTNGTRGALATVLRNGKASTLDIVRKVKETLPKILAGLPPELTVRQLFDQSVFVRATIAGVVREAVIAAFLTGMMILLFLGSWRSTIIVCISIPLSILTSLIILDLMGHTINVMTLGGMALAVGILVDDATVEIENTHRNMAMKKPRWRPWGASRPGRSIARAATSWQQRARDPRGAEAVDGERDEQVLHRRAHRDGEHGLLRGRTPLVGIVVRRVGDQARHHDKRRLPERLPAPDPAGDLLRREPVAAQVGDPCSSVASSRAVRAAADSSSTNRHGSLWCGAGAVSAVATARRTAAASTGLAANALMVRRARGTSGSEPEHVLLAGRSAPARPGRPVR